nr:cytochrome c oxidase assembly protein [Cellulosimicrobium arenosum]
MFAHLTGAALWVGGLGTLAVVRVRGGLGRADFAAAVGRYSVIALWCYVAVGLSGVVNATIRVDSAAGLLTGYGILLLTKLALLLALGAFGYVHRERVVRRLGAAPAGGGTTPAGGGTTRAGGEGSGPTPRGGLSGSAAQATRGLFWRLVAVELAIMGAVSGVAVALASTAPPVPDDVILDSTAAEVVTGYPLPPEPTLGRWVTQWQWDVLAAAACAVALVVYLGWVRRLARRGERWPVGRTVAWSAGVLLALWATSGGPAMYGRVLFSAHTAQLVLLVAVVPVLLALAAPVTLLARAVPARTDGSRGPREWVLGVVTSRVGQVAANPVVATVLVAGSVVGYLWTPVLGLALTTYAGHLAATAWFVLVGYLFANALVGIDPGPLRPSPVRRLVLLLAVFVLWAVVGLVLTTSDVLLEAEWFGLLGRDWWPSAIVDQQRGGAVAWAIGELSVVTLAAIVLVRWLRSGEPAAPAPPQPTERRPDQPREDTGSRAEYDAMLAQLARRRSTRPTRPKNPPNTT